MSAKSGVISGERRRRVWRFYSFLSPRQPTERGLGIALLAWGLIAPAAFAAPAQNSTANEKAYTLALICAVVAAHYDDASGRVKTHDAVQKMGRVLGYSLDRQASNMITMASVLGVEMRRDPNNMAMHKEQCRRYGLVS